MRLIDNPVSPFSFKVRATLYEKEVEFEKNEIWNREQRDELLRVSPRGEVPALQDGDTVICDSHVICEYLDDRYPSPSLLPPDPAGRSRCRALEKIADTQIDACIFVLGLLKIFRPGLETSHPESLGRITETLRKHYENLDRELSGKEYLAGAFTRADIAVIPHVSGAAFMGFAPGTEHANVAAWAARMNERPSVLTATQEALSAFEHSQNDPDPFFENDRLHWRNDRIEQALRVGLGPWLLEEIAADRAFFSPVP